MRAIVLAGGLGTRLRAVVSAVPKPMAPVAGRPFLELLLDYWIAQGVTDLILAVGYLHAQLQQHFGGAYCGVPITWSIEYTPLGTGGALLAGWQLSARDRPVLVLNGDTFFDVSLAAMHRTLAAHAADGVIAVFEAHPDARYAGIVTDADGRVRSFGGQPPQQSAWMNGGAYLLAPSFFERACAYAGRAASLESEILPAVLAGGGTLYAHHASGRFIDIGIAEDYRRAAEVLGAPRAAHDD